MELYNKKVLFALAAILFATYGNAQVQVVHLLCNNLTQPLGVDDPRPAFSWQLSGERRNISQSAYEIRTGRDKNSVLKGQQPEWSSGKINSSQSVHVRYNGSPLASGTRYYWQVRVWDEKGKASGWSDAGYWETGLLKAGDWKAQWIGPGYKEDSIIRPSPLFRRQFTATERVAHAVLYITAHGLYEARLNGQRVSDEHFAPGYTEYDHRLQYQAYDVTQLIHKGNNTAGVLLGDGWYRGVFGPWGTPNNYGKDASLLYQLIITYKDGKMDTIVSDNRWKSSTGGIRYADFYYGEIYDANKEPAGWMQNGFDDSGWAEVGVRSFSKDNLIASIVNPVREQEVLSPVRMLTSPKGERIIDFGQNLAGWVRCRIRGQAGDTIRIFHAEVLDKKGNFYTLNLRNAKAEDTYILKDNRDEVFEPHFTFHGFRYIKIEGLKGEIRPGDFQSVALYSDIAATGHFHCSDSMINRLQQNIVWSQQSNFIDFPTDCPQRAERQGWLGDAQVFTATAVFNKRVDNFFAKWLQDLSLAKGADGGMPDVVPDIRNHVWHRLPAGVAGWGDAATIIPWTLFDIYNDTSRLAESYSSMQAWVGYIKQHTVKGLWKGGGFGDWQAPAPTDLAYISQCFYYYSTLLSSKAAGVLGKREDSLYYSALKDAIRAAFLREYMTPDGRAISNTQAAYVLALYMGLIPPNMATRCVERLVELIHEEKDHPGTGFLATPYLCFVLTQYGYTDLAYTLLEQTTIPSWLYPVKMGATTIWERWNEIMPDSSIVEGSFNHYSYGAIGDWLYRVVAGISPGTPGYQKIIIHPHIGGGLNEADASYASDYGTIHCGWHLDKGQLRLEVEVPANTRAEIWIPTNNANEITEEGKLLRQVQSLIVLPPKENSTRIEAGSGKYTFVVTQ